ncbi:hypothetical protein [Micromonospora sp. NPDC023814]|uniref:hypothetical protein n=1 Tax=Micromonospora sp. NPDC023814 TaxID=3154596 RepID=UPI0033F26C0E
MVRLDAARGLVRGLGAVVEAEDLLGLHGGADRQEHVAVDRGGRSGGGPFDGGDLEGVDAVPEPGRHDLPDGGQRPCCRFAGAVAQCGSGDLQRDGEGDGLLVVEQQRR